MHTQVEVVAVIPKGRDVVTHVRLKQIEDVEIVELRDYISSTGEYGRGYWIPRDRDVLSALISALVEVSNRGH